MRGLALFLLCLTALGTRPAAAADLQPRTVAAFERYVRATEARMAASTQFLWTDSLPEPQRKTAADTLRRGEFVIEPLTTKEAGKDIDIPDGIVHHWLGVVFAPDVTIDRAVALLQDYDHHADIYKPNVARSKLLSRSGDDFTVYLRFFTKKVITVVVNSEHVAHFTRHAADRVSSRIYSTRIAEVENPDTPKEHEKPVGDGGGYLWRLNSYWRFQQRPEGVYIQCESVTLTRGIPTRLRLARASVRDQSAARDAGVHARDHPQSPGAAGREVKALTRRRGGPSGPPPCSQSRVFLTDRLDADSRSGARSSVLPACSARCSTSRRGHAARPCTRRTDGRISRLRPLGTSRADSTPAVPRHSSSAGGRS